MKGINKKLFILSRLNAFRTCSVHFNVQRVHISALGHCMRIKVSM